jgi:hypothetical protein
MSLESIVSELKQERDRINRVIAALDGTMREGMGQKQGTLIPRHVVMSQGSTT